MVKSDTYLTVSLLVLFRQRSTISVMSVYYADFEPYQVKNSLQQKTSINRTHRLRIVNLLCFLMVCNH